MNYSTSSDFPADLAQSTENTSDSSIRNGFTEDNICGEGASCIVYRMHWQGLQVAVKRLREEHRSNATFVSSYRKEHQLGLRLRHDGLPIYRDIHAASDEVYIVMDFIDGDSVEEFLLTDEGRNCFSSAGNAQRFFDQLLGVVTYLHRSGVVHCDIKAANIMLRKSDRGVMVLDLDKAYADSMDRSHGGTATMSDLMADGETPTAVKDFLAIGNLIDYISEKVSDFPKRRFRKLLRECRNVSANDDSLLESLQSKSHAGAWMAVTAALCFLAGGVYYYSNHTATTEEVRSDGGMPAVISDTVKIYDTVKNREEIHPGPVEVTVAPQTKPMIVTADFDKRMSTFIKKATESLTSLHKGNVPDKEIHDMMDDMLTLYSSEYHSLLKDYKSENPHKSGIDVELEVARAQEHSKAAALRLQLSQAIADTMSARHPWVD